MNHLIGRIFSRIWMFLRRDFWRKLIALCFAFFTYFAVQAQLAGEQKLTGVPVEIRLPPELISVGRQDFLVSVTARGPKSSLRNFEGSQGGGGGPAGGLCAGGAVQSAASPLGFPSGQGCQRQFDRSAVWGAGAESAAEGVTECSDTTEILRAAGAELPACRCALHSL